MRLAEFYRAEREIVVFMVCRQCKKGTEDIFKLAYSSKHFAWQSGAPRTEQMLEPICHDSEGHKTHLVQRYGIISKLHSLPAIIIFLVIIKHTL